MKAVKAMDEEILHRTGCKKKAGADHQDEGSEGDGRRIGLCLFIVGGGGLLSHQTLGFL